MKNQRMGKHGLGSCNLALIAASVAFGLSGCYDGLESDEELEPYFPGFEIPAEG